MIAAAVFKKELPNRFQYHSVPVRVGLARAARARMKHLVFERFQFDAAAFDLVKKNPDILSGQGMDHFGSVIGALRIESEISRRD